MSAGPAGSLMTTATSMSPSAGLMPNPGSNQQQHPSASIHSVPQQPGAVRGVDPVELQNRQQRFDDLRVDDRRQGSRGFERNDMPPMNQPPAMSGSEMHSRQQGLANMQVRDRGFDAPQVSFSQQAPPQGPQGPPPQQAPQGPPPPEKEYILYTRPDCPNCVPIHQFLQQNPGINDLLYVEDISRFSEEVFRDPAMSFIKGTPTVANMMNGATVGGTKKCMSLLGALGAHTQPQPPPAQAPPAQGPQGPAQASQASSWATVGMHPSAGITANPSGYA